MLAHGADFLGARLGFGPRLERLADSLPVQHDCDLERALARGMSTL
jgi:hypothetical protein